MSTICDEQQNHKFHSSYQPLSPKKPLREIDIPPRKLLTRRTTAADMFSDDTILQKYLPHNDSDSDSDDPYSSDHFRMYEFKVRRCTRSRSHDWTDCPFAHPGEKARRRDPRRFHYSGTVCPDYRRGGCNRGDSCEFAHGVFECWLHPARYRTEACKDGKNCKRKVCFFAHTPRQLRILPVTSSSSNSNEQFSCNKKNNKLLNNHVSSKSNHGCLFCRCGGNANANNSPTSTLFGMSHFSPPASPPVSPMKPRNGVSSLSRYGSLVDSNNLRYRDMLIELLGSFEGLNFNDGSSSSSVVSGLQNQNNTGYFNVPVNSEEQIQKQHFNILSPSIQQSLTPVSFNEGDNNINNNMVFLGDNENNKVLVGGDVPDLGWVNDLLM
ncbi:unnamed protein product [Vicia faba]|uniref:C3H1-type domain-containing protein n=1 Tax=Vicia faba TaxID=3906 RepID=A0AAV0Z4W3_VICFA|nr:unnamed protein product [Vicia faba]